MYIYIHVHSLRNLVSKTLCVVLYSLLHVAAGKCLALPFE